MAPLKLVGTSDHIVRDIRTASFQKYQDADGNLVLGQSYLQLGDTFPTGADFTMCRMEP